MDMLVNIDVDDLERATLFYTNAFALQVGRRFGIDAVELLGGTAPIYLLAKAAGSTAFTAPLHKTQQRIYQRHWTPVHLDIVVQDIDQSLQRAVNAGAILERDVQTNNWGKIALLADPFGHGFCLIQFIGRGYDEITST